MLYRKQLTPQRSGELCGKTVIRMNENGPKHRMISELAKKVNTSSQADERQTFKDLFY